MGGMKAEPGPAGATGAGQREIVEAEEMAIMEGAVEARLPLPPILAVTGVLQALLMQMPIGGIQEGIVETAGGRVEWAAGRVECLAGRVEWPVAVAQVQVMEGQVTVMGEKGGVGKVVRTVQIRGAVGREVRVGSLQPKLLGERGKGVGEVGTMEGGKKVKQRT
jgi:hypothetical protein